MIRAAVIAAALAAAHATPAAASGSDQLRRLVAAELAELGIEADVDRLNTAQLAAIHAIAHRQGRDGGKRGGIRSVIGGPDTLRGLFGLGG